MSSTPHNPRCLRRGRAAAIALVLLAALLGSVPAAGAATTSAVSTASANPPAFVPDWDGHTDSTVIDYRLAERSAVLVRILDARGRIVATIGAGRREAGPHLVSWDGRGDDGRVLPVGTYRVRVDARPIPAPRPAGEPGAAAMGGAVVVAGARAATIQVQAPAVAVRGVKLGRAALGRTARTSATTVSFDLTTTASISAAIVDAQGTAVRTLATGRMRAGAHVLAWDGRSAGGARLPDGDYALVVAATGTGQPTATTRMPVRIDRTAPTLDATARYRGAATSAGVVLPIRVSVAERTTLVLRIGRRTVRRTLDAGTHTLRIPANRFGISASRRAQHVQLRMFATDEAGNAVARSATVVVPPVTRVQPRPTPKPPVPTPAGRLPWPVAGVVTSEFGPRWGRMHTGIDIAAPTDTPIHPAGSGTVSYVGVLGGYGNVVWVDHEGDLRTYYAHMSRFGAFGVGDRVGPLDVIGYVGCTGSCSGPHVHFETRVKDVPRDPLSLLAPR